jgi:hypothetical protein
MMQGQHSHGVAYYRCSYPEEYALANNIDLPRNVIMREETLIRPVDTWLFQEFSPLQRRQTIASRPVAAGDVLVLGDRIGPSRRLGCCGKR